MLLRLIFILILFNSLIADILIVPDPSASIQYSIDSAQRGDTVLVRPGFYEEQLVFSDTSIVLASQYIFSQDISDVANTIIDGNNAAYVINIESTADSGISIIGLTIQNGDDGIWTLSQYSPEKN